MTKTVPPKGFVICAFGIRSSFVSRASSFSSCHTKATLKILTLRRALRQAGGIYEMSQTCSQNSSDSAVGGSYGDCLRADDDQRCRRNLPVSHLLKMVRRVRESRSLGAV